MKGCRVSAGISSTERGLRGQRGAEQVVAGRAAWEGTAGDHGASQQVRLGREAWGGGAAARDQNGLFKILSFFFFN